ncbi:uncharacterized protein EI90DRAFT_3059388 [Cantharellus anzutake]|uniref:uncharacterized protein n=1 Tax=Cantharellus anzutake TaxID=1750568 RepID=UPI001903173D|nr:uncharacterized protein EI90DRAFT_3059388 [Cantharellus anzutake]KAF8330823.1 hypothetical protein EI90DRAFT_3059388 [Cantharellus anzutake]
MGASPNFPTSSSPQTKRPPGIERTFGKLEETSDTPKVHQGRTLILCFDGTAEEYGERNTNVVRLLSCLEQSHPKQLVYYQTGIGTIPTSYHRTSFGKWACKITDQAVASHIEEHVCAGYRFLQSNWKEGDTICFFGFSRGAYVARALAGMLHTVGLLYASHPQQVESAYKVYTTARGTKLGFNYKRDLCRVVKIDFLGVWDTVSSVGLLYSSTLPCSQSNSSVIVFRHAMALDERRARFIPSPWRLSSAVKERGHEGWECHGSNTNATDAAVSWTLRVRDIINIFFSSFIEWWLCHIMDRLGYHSGNGPKRVLIPKEGSPPDVKEVWFAGGHCDVGGGNELDDKPGNECSDKDESKYSPALANISLRWMIRELHEANEKYFLNVRWRPIRLACYGVILPEIPYTNDGCNTTVPKAAATRNNSVQHPSVRKFQPRDTDVEELKKNPERAKFLRYQEFKTGVIYDRDFIKKDLAAPAYDELWKWDECTFGGIISMLFWWFLELAPLMTSVQNKHTFLWESKFRFNLFQPRHIPRDPTPDVYEGALSDSWVKFLEDRSKPRYHWSVSERMKIKPDYCPRPWRADKNIEKNWTKYH